MGGKDDTEIKAILIQRVTDLKVERPKTGPQFNGSVHKDLHGDLFFCQTIADGSF